MRNTVILFSSLFLLFSFLSCNGKQQTRNETLAQTTAPSEFVQPVSDEQEVVPSTVVAAPEPVAPVVKTENPVQPMAKEVKSQQKEKSDTPISKTKDSTPTSVEQLEKVKKETESEVKVRKSPETVEEVEPIIEHEEEVKPQPQISHDKWDQLLKKYVSASGKVNYKGFKADKANLQTYLDYLSANPPQADWSRNKIRAFWINAYNAFTVKTIVDNYPLKSITDLGKPWDKAFISIGGKTYSLNDIEHKILRAKYFDSRIHFAVNCASFSCPKILNKAFTEANVSAQMQALAVSYINNPSHNKISPEKAELSQLFEWYKGDFTKKGSLIDYINKYSKVKLNPDAKISYMPYNWNLNE